MNRDSRFVVSIAIPLICMAAACGAPASSEQASPDTLDGVPSQERLQSLDHDLAIGATGEDVRAVHAYLKRAGYFPNEKLAREYPAWRPVVARAPQDASVYDERTVEAVGRMQTNYGLAATGVVDEPTRIRLREHRCGFPDGLETLDPSNKYSVDSLNGAGIPAPNASYFLNIFAPDAVNRFNGALNSWMAVTDQHFIPGGEADLDIFYASNSDLGGLLMGTGPSPWPKSNRRIRVNYEVAWYYGASVLVPGNQTDFQSAVVHELGHAMGLGHSSEHSAVMYPTLGPGVYRRDLHLDDKVAISFRRDIFAPALNGLAMDIGVGGPDGQSVWVLGTDGSIWKWNGANDFIPDSANGDARSITVDANGIPWVGAPWGVYFRTSSDPATGSWAKRNGSCVLDVGAGGTDIWMVDCDHDLYKFDGGLWWNLDVITPRHTANRVAVDREGLPWVVRTNDTVYHRSTTDPFTGYYADLPGAFADVGVGPCCYAWGAAWIGAPGSLSAFNYQGSDPAGATAYWRWISKLYGRSSLYQVTNVAVGPQGEPWFIDDHHNIFRTTK